LNARIINEKEAKQFFGKVLPDSVRYTIANTLTRAVYKGMEASEEQVRDDFFLRGSYVIGKTPGKGAIKYEKAIPSHDIKNIAARWGSVDKVGSRDYAFMEKQESGFENENKPVPNASQVRKGGSEKEKVKTDFYLKKAQIRKMSDFGGVSGNDKKARIIRMRAAYKAGYGKPGSNELFSFDDNEYNPGWEGGLFQFAGNEPPRDDLHYPNVRRLYYNPEGKSRTKKRRARHWMEKSGNTITQSDFDKIYAEEFNKQLARNLKKF